MTALARLVHQGAQPYCAVAEVLSSAAEYRFDLDKLCQPAVPERDPVLHPSGSNLASVLDALQNTPGSPAFSALQQALNEAVPTLRGIVLPTVREKPGEKEVEFILAGNGQSCVTIPAALASRGALLLTAFLTLAHARTPGLLLLEEPENGLHPFRLRLLIELLRKVSRGEVGRKRQVVITTHSPLLLHYARPEEVRILARDPERGTRVTPMTQVPEIDKLVREFAAGEPWYLPGEEELLEGQPA